jgi:hypothetical protein
VLVDLIYGWGNAGWSALSEFLAGCIHEALVSTGSILECGSGLSTIVVGAITARQGRTYWALEHDPHWARKVARIAGRYQLDGLKLCVKPLKDYGEYCWYDAPLDSMPRDFGLVICDGPPGTTKGGRYGLVPIMKERLNSRCVVLVDDAGREQERAMTDRWKTEVDAALEFVGKDKPFIKMTLAN